MSFVGTVKVTPEAHGLRPVGDAGAARVEIVAAADLESHVGAWQALADNAVEPNAFYEPWMLLPAVRAFGAEKSLLFVLVWGTPVANAPGSPRLVGFFPLEARRRCKGLPARVLGLWKHVHCFLCTPLVDREQGREALLALFDWARQDRQGGGVLEFDCVLGDGPFHQLLIEVLNERGLVTFTDEEYNRAMIRRGVDAEAYVGASMSTGNRKELRRQRRRLGEAGKLEERVLKPGDDVDSWIDGFLHLEAEGWKGQEHTALAASQVERDYFRTIARAAHERGQLIMLGLFLDGRPIALKCNFLGGAGGFTFKIAYDEEFAKYSPGVQLELDNIRHLHEHPTLEWLDSCASAKHFMINRLWRERRTIRSLLISTGRLTGDLLVGALPLLRALRRMWRRWR